jgi:hypothetical protein
MKKLFIIYIYIINKIMNVKNLDINDKNMDNMNDKNNNLDKISPMCPILIMVEKYKFNNNLSKFNIFNFLLMIFAGYLAWGCNMLESDGIRILYTIFAMIFPGIYILYYLIYRKILNNDCLADSIEL